MNAEESDGDLKRGKKLLGFLKHGEI